jgi:hypothetical protein
MMGGRLVDTGVSVVLASLLALDGFMVVRNTLFRRPGNFAPRSAVLVDGISPRLENAYAGDATAAVASTPAQRGYVLRYSSQSCQYSRNDLLWPNLAEAFVKNHFAVSVLIPDHASALLENQVFPKSARQIAYVPLDWIAHFQLTVTPTILAFDADGRLLWHRVGMLRGVDVQEAMAAITTAGPSTAER